MPCPSFCACSRCALPFKGTWGKITNCLHPTTPHASSKMGRNVTRGVVAGQLVTDTTFTGVTVDSYFPDMVVKGSQACLSFFIVFKRGSTIIERSFHGLLMIIAAAILGVEFFLYKAAQACPLASSTMLPVALCLAQFALIIAYKCLLLAGFAASELSKEPYKPTIEPQPQNVPGQNLAIEIPTEQKEEISEEEQKVDRPQTFESPLEGLELLKEAQEKHQEATTNLINAANQLRYRGNVNNRTKRIFLSEPFQRTQVPPTSTPYSNNASSQDGFFDLDEHLKNPDKKQYPTNNTITSPFWEGKKESPESSSISSQVNSAP